MSPKPRVWHPARAVYQLEAAQTRQLMIKEQQIVMMVSGQSPQRGIAVGAKLNPPVPGYQQVINQTGNERIVFDLKNRDR